MLRSGWQPVIQGHRRVEVVMATLSGCAHHIKGTFELFALPNND